MWHIGKEFACQHRKCRFNPWVRKIPWSRKWQPTPVFLSGKFHGERSLADYSPWGHKDSDVTEHTHNLPSNYTVPFLQRNLVSSGKFLQA